MEMKRRTFLNTLAGSSVMGLGPLAQWANPNNTNSKQQPNIVFIFIDDLGYGDLGCTGFPYAKTPNIDRLANEGIRFTQFYVNSPICSPSRVAITTGCYPMRYGIHSYLSSRKANRQRNMADYLDPKAPTIARTLKDAGYATAHFGKWHMGGGRDVDDAPHPKAYGFDESLVSFEGLGDRVLPLPAGGLTRQSKKLGQGEITEAPKHELTEIYVNRGIDFIKRHKDQPFYLQIWPNDIHDAYHPKENLMEKYKHLSENPYLQQYCAVLDELDRQIGRLIDTIDKAGLAERTLIMLTGDNGPTAWPHYYKKGFSPPGETNGMRGRKWSLYEGGIREPFIARWKGSIKPGQLDPKTLMAGIDLFPTICKLTKAECPTHTFDGEDMSQALLGETQEREKPLFWRYGVHARLRPGLEKDQSPTLAIRQGKWKLLMNPDGSSVELYNLDSDRAESTNVAEKHPELTQTLKNKVLVWNESLQQKE